MGQGAEGDREWRAREAGGVREVETGVRLFLSLVALVLVREITSHSLGPPARFTSRSCSCILPYLDYLPHSISLVYIFCTPSPLWRFVICTQVQTLCSRCSRTSSAPTRLHPSPTVTSRARFFKKGTNTAPSEEETNPDANRPRQTAQPVIQDRYVQPMLPAQLTVAWGNRQDT